MRQGIEMRNASRTGLAGVTAGAGLLLAAAAASAAPSAAAGYNIAVFATAPAGATAPDSITRDGNHVFVGYGNGVASDGSDGKSSTIVEYTNAGTFVRSFSVAGHNDGLKIDPSMHLLWAIQNEDAAPQLQVINPVTGTASVYSFSATPHGGGYDDLVFGNGQVFVSASNPTLTGGVNAGPQIVRVTLGNGGVATVTAALPGNVTATDVVSGTKASFNNTDPDSMTLDLQGNIVIDDQSDSQLGIVHQPGTAQQSVDRLPLRDPTGALVNVDDTLFAPSPGGKLLVADRNSNTVFAVSGPAITTGAAFSADPTDNLLGSLNAKTGVLTPVVTGLSSPHGLGFIPGARAVPLPAAAWSGLATLAGIAVSGRLRQRLARA